MANKIYWGYNPTTQRYDVLDNEVDTTPAVDWAIVEGTCQITFETQASNIATFMLSKA